MLRLELSNIDKKYGEQEVLKGLSASFDETRTYVLMGGNGSGKSTLLRICALIEEPHAGRVEYLSGGAVAQKDVSLRRRLTLVLPGIGIFNSSVFDNAAYGLKIRGVKKDEMRERAFKALAFVGLSGKASQNARSLSSGEAQRLGIARAIVIEPEALFLDEPTAFVDEKSKAAVEEIILRLRGNRLVIIATHDRAQAEKLADETLYIKDGMLTK